MEITNIKKYLGTPFIIECLSIENRPGEWNSTKVSIYRDDILIGEYLRNYSNYAKETFYPFLVNKEWYALYSTHYTATRVMKLHDDRIEDWCGENVSAGGFCPVEFYIPRYRHSTHSMEIRGETHKYDGYFMDNDYKDDAAFLADELKSITPVELEYTNFGFMCGCVWGDDTSWKLRYIDLSKVADKELLITDKFGYWELPNNQSLKKCIDLSGWEPNHNWIALTRMEHINLKTGERC